MLAVKIKNLNKSHMKKTFIVKGRIKYLRVDNNRNSSGQHLNSILFDDSSEIEVVAFKNCEDIYKLLNTGNVVAIENAILREVNKDYKKTKHKYKIILESNSIITMSNDEDLLNNNFPIQKYTSGAELKTLMSGMLIDVIGVCVQIESEKTVNIQSQTCRWGKIKIDSTEIEVRFYGEKADKLYEVGSTLSLSCVTYNNFKGCIFLTVGHSSSVLCIPKQLSNGIDIKDIKIELPDQEPSTSTLISTPCIKNLVVELPDQRPSTSSSTSSNKRKTQDFNVEGETSKIPKMTELDESFLFPEPDEIFVRTMMNLMEKFNDNDKYLIKMRVLELISEILKEKK